MLIFLLKCFSTSILYNDDVNNKAYVVDMAFNLGTYIMDRVLGMRRVGSAGDSWHSRILISGSSFIFADEMNNFRYYLTSSAPCLKGFANTKL